MCNPSAPAQKLKINYIVNLKDILVYMKLKKKKGKNGRKEMKEGRREKEKMTQ